MADGFCFIWLHEHFVIEPPEDNYWLATDKIKYGGMQEIGRCVGCGHPVIAVRVQEDKAKGLAGFDVFRCRSNGCKQMYKVAGNQIETYFDLLMSTGDRNQIQSGLIGQYRCQEVADTVRCLGAD